MVINFANSIDINLIHNADLEIVFTSDERRLSFISEAKKKFEFFLNLKLNYSFFQKIMFFEIQFIFVNSLSVKFPKYIGKWIINNYRNLRNLFCFSELVSL